MYFSKLPQGFPGVGSDIIFELDNCEPDMVTEVRIMKDGEILGIKRFRGETSYKVNASCYLKGTIEDDPFLTTRSGFIEMSRMLPEFNLLATQYSPRDDRPQEDSLWIDSGPVPYTAADIESPVETTLTEIQDAFTIVSGETFLLPLISKKRSMSGILRVYTPDFIHEVFFVNPGIKEVNMYYFVVNPTSIENIIDMKVDSTMDLEAIVIGTGNEVLISRQIAVREKIAGEVRLCWINRYGTVDYYTFSPVQQETINTEKNRVLSPDGRRISHVDKNNTVTVQSPFLPAAHIRQICGIVTSPRVWQANGLDAVEIDVLSDHILIDSEGPQKLVLTYRLT